MVEIFAWLSVHATAADEDQLPPDYESRMLAQVQEILRQSGCGVRLQYMNGQAYLQTAFCSNHRTAETSALIDLFTRIAETASGSYGVLYLRDDEDARHHNDMQVYQFRRGTVSHRIEPDFSPCIPKMEDSVCIPEKELHVTEKDKAAAGFLYDANYDKELIDLRLRCLKLCRAYNDCMPGETEKLRGLFRQIIPETGEGFTVMQPFRCDYGSNIRIGKNFYANYNLVILDAAQVTFGDNVFVAPNCVFTAAGHAIDETQRNQGLEIALPITVGNSVWFGANVTVLPGVTIGDNVIIGAGSVVTKDIPSGVIAVGSPCRVLREITEADKRKYPVYEG